MMPRFVLKCLLVASAGMSSAFAAPADAELVALVKRHAEAQATFDLAALKAITADNYAEVSPVGEVDSREKMLSFYAPELKRPAPQLQVDEPQVRVLGHSAVIYTRLTFTMGSGDTARTFAMRAGYVAQFKDGKWLLVSAQYTGIRPPKN
ncbi:DUF4440 domain-containing protein [Pseudoduganella sp. FT25W]|uniref:DUF4440 domain-containing protein n=2 Tax=Duganella alba TaxID=2666081 RepID=A0A6L5QNF2_9BURK|nr:nuclear transport factor 2 family protein [Duganella alba]MRX11207.1 DUF4440 domain-containing protein [Duganella alba]MRX19322.1 DUF4440 domain-containing protein [Duganella alba]